ncbi:MAG: tetratricopeptide repeat protein [Spirochaetota bacterium]
MEKRKVTIQRNAVEQFLMICKEFILNHRRPVVYASLFLLAALVLFLAGAVFYDYRSGKELHEYEKIVSSYEEGPKDAASFNDAVGKLVKLTDGSYFGYVHKNGYYVAAGMYFERKMYDDAKKYYLLFEDKNSSSVFSPIALSQAGICAESAAHFDEAFDIYKKIEKSYKDTAFNDRLMYDLGRMCAKKGDKVTAKEYFNKVITQYPNSWFAPQARIRLFLLGL